MEGGGFARALSGDRLRMLFLLSLLRGVSMVEEARKFCFFVVLIWQNYKRGAGAEVVAQRIAKRIAAAFAYTADL